MSERVVVVAQSFAPVGGSHATRVDALTRELEGRFDTRGIAPKIGARYPQLTDASPRVPVLRTYPGPFHAVAHGTDPTEGNEHAEATERARARPSAVLRLRSLGMRLFRALEVVDSYFDWIPFLARAVRGAAKPGVVFVSMSMPNSAHVGTLLGLRRRSNWWIADFADPWTLNASQPVSGIRGLIERALERRVVRRANEITFVTRATLDAYLSAYPHARAKMKLVTMGYDPADARAQPRDFSSRPVVFYGGALPTENRDPALLLDAVRLIPQVEFRFSGASVEQVIDHFGDDMPKNVLLEAWLGHSAFCATVRGADACLILGNANPQQVPGKVYQLLGMAQRILYVPRLPATDDEARQAMDGQAEVLPVESASAMAEAIVAALAAPPRELGPSSRFAWPIVLTPIVESIGSSLRS